jgi:hypothetical protein
MTDIWSAGEKPIEGNHDRSALSKRSKLPILLPVFLPSAYAEYPAAIASFLRPHDVVIYSSAPAISPKSAQRYSSIRDLSITGSPFAREANRPSMKSRSVLPECLTGEMNPDYYTVQLVHHHQSRRMDDRRTEQRHSQKSSKNSSTMRARLSHVLHGPYRRRWYAPRLF